jgi:hypothetical protein
MHAHAPDHPTTQSRCRTRPRRAQPTTQAHYPGPYGAQAAGNLTEFRGRLLGDLIARNFDTSFGAEGLEAWCAVSLAPGAYV